MHYTWIFTSIYLYFFFAHWTCPTCNKRYQMVLMSPPLLTLTLFAAARATRRPRSRGRSAPSSRTWSGPSSSGSCATATTPTPPRYARGMFGVIRRLWCEDYRLFLSQNLILSQNLVLVSHAIVFFSHFFEGLPSFKRLSNDAILILRRRLRVCRMTHFKIINIILVTPPRPRSCSWQWAPTWPWSRWGQWHLCVTVKCVQPSVGLTSGTPDTP